MLQFLRTDTFYEKPFRTYTSRSPLTWDTAVGGGILDAGRFYSHETVSYDSATIAKSCIGRNGLNSVSDRSCTRTFTHVCRNNIQHAPFTRFTCVSDKAKISQKQISRCFAHWKCFKRFFFKNFYYDFSPPGSVPFGCVRVSFTDRL